MQLLSLLDKAHESQLVSEVLQYWMIRPENVSPEFAIALEKTIVGLALSAKDEQLREVGISAIANLVLTYKKMNVLEALSAVQRRELRDRLHHSKTWKTESEIFVEDAKRVYTLLNQ